MKKNKILLIFFIYFNKNNNFVWKINFYQENKKEN